ncbi:MAG: hypothetical protein AAGU19_06200 [Prolixibacteraceae bacterium]
MNKRNLIVSRIHLIILFLLPGFVAVEAQNNTSNPYSMYGLGELRSQTSAANAAMGSAGFGLSSNAFLNTLNPASYTGIDSLNFMFEVGIDGKSSNFKSQGNSAHASDGNLSYLAMGWRVNNWLAAGLGLNPFSHSGYEINTTAWIEGSITEYPLDITGSGNISRAYGNLAFTPYKNLSFGVKPSYIFGSLEQNQYHNLSVIGSNAISNSTKDYFHNFFFEFGAQYTLNLKPGDLTIGAIYNPGTSLVTKRTNSTYDSAGNVYQSESESTDDFIIPEEYGIGFSFKNNKNFLCVLDAGLQKWSSHDYDLSGVKLKDNPYVRSGFQFTPTNNYLAKYYKKINYRAGFQYAKSYLNLRGIAQDEICISLGFGLPVHVQNQNSRIDVSFEGGRNGTTEKGLIQENFLRMRIGFSLKDIWFQHRRYN